MKRLLLTVGFALALAMGTPAFAQEPPPSYVALSTGNQKIVDAIYDSHLEAGGSMTTDDIAALKAETGWGNVYKQLYADGLVTHRNLGQAISSNILDNKFGTTTTVVTTGAGGGSFGAGRSSFGGGGSKGRSGGSRGRR